MKQYLMMMKSIKSRYLIIGEVNDSQILIYPSRWGKENTHLSKQKKKVSLTIGILIKKEQMFVNLPSEIPKQIFGGLTEIIEELKWQFHGKIFLIMINHFDLKHLFLSCVFSFFSSLFLIYTRACSCSSSRLIQIMVKQVKTEMMMNEKVAFFLIMCCSCSLRKAVGVDEQRERERKGISN